MDHLYGVQRQEMVDDARAVCGSRRLRGASSPTSCGFKVVHQSLTEHEARPLRRAFLPYRNYPPMTIFRHLTVFGQFRPCKTLSLGISAWAPNCSHARMENTTSSITTPARAIRSTAKGSRLIELIARQQGATMAEIVEATGWCEHTVRGYVSTVNQAREVRSFRDSLGRRRYIMQQ